jgi:hypothetical protein
MRSMLRGISLLLLPLVSLSSPADAQEEAKEIGIFVGLNMADFHGADATGADNRTGFQGGGFISFPFSRSLAIQFGLGYSQQGAKVDVGGGTSGTFQLDYILVPAFLKLSAPLANNRSLRPHVYMGPVLGFKTKCKVKVQGGGVPTTEFQCDDPNLQLETKSTDFSLAIGAGLDIGAASVGVRYQLGLTKIDDTSQPADIKNRVFAIIGGYRFRLGR